MFWRQSRTKGNDQTFTQHLFIPVYYVYCLQHLKHKELYYGYTEDLRRRLKEHKREDKNWELIYYEAYRSEIDARTREQKLKDYGQSRTHLKRRIAHSLLEQISAGCSILQSLALRNIVCARE